MDELTFPSPETLLKNSGYSWHKGLETICWLSSVISKPSELEGWLRNSDEYGGSRNADNVSNSTRSINTMLVMAYGAFHNPLILSREVSLSETLFYTAWKVKVSEIFEEIPEPVLIDFAEDESEKVRENIAKRNNLPKPVQMILLCDESISVRRALSHNLNVDEDIRILAALN